MSSNVIALKAPQTRCEPETAPQAAGLMATVLRFAPRRHLALAGLALASAPVLYLTLEIPKWIVNGALATALATAEGGGACLPHLLESVDPQIALPILCAAQLVLLAVLSGIKFTNNVGSANLGERFLRRMRMDRLRAWHATPAARRDRGIAPVLTQEMEAVAGFAGGAVSIPLAQAAAFVTVMAFLVMQDWRLALAAVALTPVQAFLVPLLLRRIRQLKRERIAVVRRMCSRLSEVETSDLATALIDSRRAQDLRFEIHRRKFAMKAIYNMIGHMTPLAYLAIGGWLVLAGDLSLGALVAALSAYREGAGPMREMFSYYIRWSDARTRWAAIQAPEEAPHPEVKAAA